MATFVLITSDLPACSQKIHSMATRLPPPPFQILMLTMLLLLLLLLLLCRQSSKALPSDLWKPRTSPLSEEEDTFASDAKTCSIPWACLQEYQIRLDPPPPPPPPPSSCNIRL
ncbi:MAG: hypothetical protein Q8P67_03395 [archaeon]|nr:hypothetical protein [archaeon]